jgi:hypothetical protein
MSDLENNVIFDYIRIYKMMILQDSVLPTTFMILDKEHLILSW